MSDRPLRLFEWGDGGCGDFVIAYNQADAEALLATVTDSARDDEGFAWTVWPDDKPLRIVEIDEPGQPSETKLVREWVQKFGRGYWYGWA